MMTRLMLLATLTVCGVSMAQERSEDCSKWQVIKATTTPTWYASVLDATRRPDRTMVGDHVWRTTYPLSDSVHLVAYDKYLVVDQYTPTAEDAEYNPYPTSTLFLVNRRDSVLVDSSITGISQICVCPSALRVIAYEHYWVHDDGQRSGQVVMYDVTNRQKHVIHLRTWDTSLASDSSHGRIAYSDMGDLYISLNTYAASELVFKGGGSYAETTPCSNKWIWDICWSPDGDRVAFKYGADLLGREFDLYEAVWVQSR